MRHRINDRMNSKALALIVLMSFMAIQLYSVEGMSQGAVLYPILYVHFIYLLKN